MAIIPDVAGRLAAPVRGRRAAGAGAEAHFPDAAYAEKGATVAPDAAATVAGARSSPRSRRRPRRGGALPEGATVVSFFQRGPARDTVRALAAKRRHRLQPRPRAPDQPGPVDGRAVVAGDGVGLPGRTGRGRAAAQVLPHVHDRGGDRPARQGARAGRRGGRPAGHRHRPAPRRPGPGLRRAGRGQGRGAVPRRHLRGARARSAEGAGRLRPRASPRSSPASAG